MPDAVELLIIEHLQCKSMRILEGLSPDFDRFESFHDFLVNVHIEIEEKVVFPSLSQPLWEDSREYRAKIKQISADHKLLDTLAQNLIRWKNSQDEKLYRERLPLYYRLLAEHNEREETDLFGRWKNLDVAVYKTASMEIYNIISSFGRKRYKEAMNLTDSAFRYLFQDGQ